ncbi:hypothetical protein [Desulfosporosinus youngiae]|nr:hypothetical protein [Desulfosporosinus youngiae]
MAGERQSKVVSTPLLWEEVVQGVNPDDFHVRSFRKRLEEDFSSILHYFA